MIFLERDSFLEESTRKCQDFFLKNFEPRIVQAGVGNENRQTRMLKEPQSCRVRCPQRIPYGVAAETPLQDSPFTAAQLKDVLDGEQALDATVCRDVPNPANLPAALTLNA